MNTGLFLTKKFFSRLSRQFISGAITIAVTGVSAQVMAKPQSNGWPDGPVTFIVPFSPGGGGDTLARLYANELTKKMNIHLIVENRPGAGGNIGSAMAAKAKPDGNTIVFGTAGTMGTNHALYKNPGFAVSDFDPIAIFGTTPLTMVVSKESEFKSVADVIEHAKKHPKELTCASGGNGTASHLACIMLQQMGEVEIEHVPYKSASTAVMDIRSGRVTFIIDVTTPLMPHIKDGFLRPLAVTMNKRTPALPDVPTMIESGYPDYEIFPWYGIFAPKGTSADRLDKLHAAVEGAISDPVFNKDMTDRGTIMDKMSRTEFADLVNREYERMGNFVKEIGVTID
ncbi:MAG: tripartite tricarboxylate transporter substrate binding protein [Advenella sp.]